MIYTSIGGVYVSIVTDKWQAKFSLILSAISVIYVALTFRPSLSDLPEYLDINEAGIGSFVTLGFSFLAHAIFNDAYWQRVWSSQDEKSLKRGSWGAFFMILIVVFIFGFGGFLASWAGYVTEPDFAFFEIITSSQSRYKDFMMILTTLLAVAMNESLVDSYQNALTDCTSSLALSCGLNISITTARVFTVIINLPIAIIGLQGYDVNSIFLVACLATTTSCMPIILSIFSFWDTLINEFTAISSCLFSLASIICYGWIITGSFVDGLYHCFWEAYRWQVFIIAIISSLLGMGFFILLEAIYHETTGTPWKSFNPETKIAHGGIDENAIFIHQKIETHVDS